MRPTNEPTLSPRIAAAAAKAITSATCNRCWLASAHSGDQRGLARIGTPLDSARRLVAVPEQPALDDQSAEGRRMPRLHVMPTLIPQPGNAPPPPEVRLCVLRTDGLPDSLILDAVAARISIGKLIARLNIKASRGRSLPDVKRRAHAPRPSLRPWS